jgi:hypothetical protein
VAVFICFLFSRRSWLIPVAVSSIAIACWNFPTVVEAPAIVDFVLTCLGAIAAYFVASQLDHRLPMAA